MFLIDVEKDQSDKTKLVLDFNEKTKEELVKVNEKLVSYLKPHQVWKNIYNILIIKNPVYEPLNGGARNVSLMPIE